MNENQAPAEFAAPASVAPESGNGGIYGMPVVGPPLRRVRDVCDGLKPAPQDSAGVKVGKNVARTGLVLVSTGVTMIAVL